jgi:hypothetical protein
MSVVSLERNLVSDTASNNTLSSKKITDEMKKAYTKVQRRQFIENMLNDKFPLVPLIICIILDVILAAAAIAIQIIQIVAKSSLYYIGCG